MVSIKLTLMGSPSIEINGKKIELGRRKALALLAYLAVSAKEHPREELARLLWPETSNKDSRAALRRVLSDLNKALGDGWSISTHKHIGLNPGIILDLDIQQFRNLLNTCWKHEHANIQLCAQCNALLNEAVALYQGEFMQGFRLPDAPGFEQWMLFEEQTLRQECAEALEQLLGSSSESLQTGNYLNKISTAQRWISLEPYNERAQEALMRLFVTSGQSSAALRQYQNYSNTLEKQLNQSPSLNLQGLYEHLKTNQVGSWPKKILNNAKAENVQNSRTKIKVTPQKNERFVASPPKRPIGYRLEDDIRFATALFTGLAEPADWIQRPEITAGTVRDLIAIVAEIASQYGAQVERFIGQGMFILFGLPQLHEDDAERALHAALDIHDACEKAGFTVMTGVSTGQICYTSATTNWPATGRSELEQDVLQSPVLIGPALNHAARLQNRASAGQILVSHTTYHQTQRAFEFQTISERDDSSSVIFQLISELENPEKTRGREGAPIPLIGRDDELDILKLALDKLLDGRGGMISLVGEAGIGKSRLALELKHHAINAWEHGALFLWLESRCQEWRRNTSYWAFIDLFHNLLHYYSDKEEGKETVLASLLVDIAEQRNYPPNRIAEIGALFGNLLSIRYNSEWDDRLANASPEQVQKQTFQAVVDFFTLLASQQPIVLVFEDLHWADDLSLDMLSLLIEALPLTPLLILCIYRQDQARQGQRLATIANQKIPGFYREIHLRELLPEHSQRLARSMLGINDLSSDGNDLINQLFAQEFFLSKSWGNPFFVEEAIRALVDQGALIRQAGDWQIKIEPKALSVPESLQSLILSRVDGLQPNLKTVLRSAAVLGPSFKRSIVSQLIPDDIDLDYSLLWLEENALIFRQRVAPEVEFAFKHALIQDIVYQTISPRQREQYHYLAAQAIEIYFQNEFEDSSQKITDSGNQIEQIAYHYQRSHKADKAIEYLLKSGEKARLGYRNREASEYFMQAFNLWEQSFTQLSFRDDVIVGQTQLRWKLSALKGLGQIYHGMGRESEAEKYLLQAISVGQVVELETPALVRLYYWLGEALHWQRRYAEQVHLGQAGLDLLSESQSKTLEGALMNQIIAIGHLGRGNDEAFQELTSRTASFIEQLPYTEELRPAYVHIVLSLYNDRQVDQAVQWLEKLHTLALVHHDMRALGEVYDYQWGYAFQSGNLSQAIEGCQRAMELYPQVGDTFRVWRGHRDLAWGYLLSSDLSNASQNAETSLLIAKQLQVPEFEVESYLISGLVSLSQGNYSQARQYLDEIIDHSPQGDANWTLWVAKYSLGRALLYQGDKKAAYDQFLNVLKSNFPFHVPLGWWFNRWPLFTCLLSGLEAASQDVETDFVEVISERQATWQASQARKPSLPSLSPEQWRLLPIQSIQSMPIIFSEKFSDQLSNRWSWLDPLGNCSYSIQDRLEIRAANGRDIWHLNLSAPRLWRNFKETEGDFAIETVILIPKLSDQPHIGGLLLWQDSRKFVRLLWGMRDPNEASFEGCIDNQNIIFGRGLLTEDDRASVRKVWLRLEKHAGFVQAFCGAKSSPEKTIRWYSVGSAKFSPIHEIQVGLHAVGWIDRTIYHRPFKDGSTIQFERFEIQYIK
jgi:predicted ATPase/DNA-binding SARP family transcriptional activator/class 3 adenylate cyclase